MPRQPRITLSGVAHHITQRGNYRQKVFDDHEDYLYYSELITEYSKKHHLKILAYCLMGNHIHFIVIPKTEDSLKEVFRTVHMRHAQHINRKRKAHGHLWQGRYFSCLLDDKHLYRAMRYVENNPVRAKMVKKAWNYPYSSAKQHLGSQQGVTIPLQNTKNMISPGKWREYLTDHDKEMTEEIRMKTQRGLAIGEGSFLNKIERQINRRLVYRSPGRPRKRK